MTKLLVIDSGVGGVSILSDILKSTPVTTLTYLSDSKYFPYGKYELEELKGIVDSLVKLGLEALPNPDVIVLACNTASTQVLKHLRTYISIPIVGVVPAVKPAGQLTTSGLFGVLATPQTIASPYLENLFLSHCPNRKMLGFGSTELVVVIEDFLRGVIDQNQLEAQLVPILSPFIQSKDSQLIDVIVLACTHFPLIKDSLSKVICELAGRKIQLIDSGAAVARQLNRVLNLEQADIDDESFDIRAEMISIITRTREDTLIQDPSHEIFKDFLFRLNPEPEKI